MRFEPSEDKSDPMETTQEDKEPGFGTSASENNLRDDSPSTPLNLGCLEVPENVSPRCAMGQNHIFLEIFAVNIIEKEDPLDQILDENLILTTHHNRSDYILYDVSGGKNIKLNSKGHLILQWPDRSIEIKDFVSIRPCYDPMLDIKMSQTLWCRSCMSKCFDHTDCFTHQYVETRNSFSQVNYAVYTDGLEAKIDVTLFNLEILGMPLEVYGTVTTSNSSITHPQAKSLLFDRTCKGDVFSAHPPTVEAELSLPLSRSVTAIPRKSNLIVKVNLFLQDTLIANGFVIFHAETRSNTVAEEQIIVGNRGNVKVKVTWMEAVDDGGSAKEEEDGGSAKEEEDGGSAKEVEDGRVEEEEEKDVENEGDEKSESEFVSDDDDSIRSLKSRRLNTQEDISTRNYGRSAKEEEDGGSAKEVGDGRWEEEEEEWVEEENVENEDDEESESEFLNDSFRSLKSQGLNTQGVISTRPYDYTMKEDVMKENKEGDQEASLDRKPRRRYKQSFLEVFSVKVVGPGNVRLDEIYGFIMIDASSSPRLLFRRVHGDLHKINSQGFALLEGPREVAWCVCDEVLIVPFLFKYQDFDFVNEKNCAHYLWHNSEYDEVLCKIFGNEVGDIEVNFAVYKDGVEAHLNIILMDSLFSSSELYGTITATNSRLKDPRASSIVFVKEKLKHVEECFGHCEEVALPLSRPIITLPFGSTLGLKFNLYARGNPIYCLPVVFPVKPGMSERILSANGCSFKIQVDFFAGFIDEQPRKFGNCEGYF